MLEALESITNITVNGLREVFLLGTAAVGAECGSAEEKESPAQGRSLLQVWAAVL